MVKFMVVGCLRVNNEHPHIGTPLTGPLRCALLCEQKFGKLLPGERPGGQRWPAKPLRGVLPSIGRVEAGDSLVPRPRKSALGYTSQDGRLLPGRFCIRTLKRKCSLRR